MSLPSATNSRSLWHLASITRWPDGSAAAGRCCTSATAPIRTTGFARGGRVATRPAPTTSRKPSALRSRAPTSSRSGGVRCDSCRARPADFTQSPAPLVTALRELAGHTWEPTNWLSVHRGPYLIGAVLPGAPHVVEGNYLDLLDPQLGVVHRRELQPGDLTWLRDLTYDTEPLLASAGRITNWHHTESGLSFTCEAPHGVQVTTALRVPTAPTTVNTPSHHDPALGILWLHHPGTPTGTQVELTF